MRSCFAGLTIRPIRASALAVFKKKMFLTSLNPGRKLTWVLMLEQLYLRLQLLLPVPAGACYALLRMIELSLYYCGIYDNYVNFSDASREIFPDTFFSSFSSLAFCFRWTVFVFIPIAMENVFHLCPDWLKPVYPIFYLSYYKSLRTTLRCRLLYKMVWSCIKQNRIWRIQCLVHSYTQSHKQVWWNSQAP